MTAARHRPGWAWQAGAWLLLALYLAPCWYMVGRSFLRIGPATGGGWALTLDHYRAVLGGAGFLGFVWNSLLVLIGVVGANVVFALLSGYAFARYRFPGRSLLFTGLLTTLMVPKQILMIPILDLMVRCGLQDTLWALILPFAVDGFNVFLLRQFIVALPPDLEEAARADGASELQVLARVVFPLCRPALVVVVVNTAVVTWNAFLFPLILTDSEAARTLPIGLALLTQGPFATDWGALMAGSTISSLPLLLAFWFFQDEIIQGLTAGAFRE
ncbi:MAG: Maltose/maltodextrin ABC transporter, permease protein MalG [Candidatus Ozemobacter sibiricus]|uniref:Maltose/maltodextrin ABC transporter, permease protein MalG n=1 Tax=Candidatus Ozemobacter sibiricus TaxID=2268124 RepID=A0A367ZJM0_9BACT|nr:MAG: Maltose/maltodextrin ABC transporter, permease protein MalG [Candidatus Ozemobacter sibiricus]